MLLTVLPGSFPRFPAALLYIYAQVFSLLQVHSILSVADKFTDKSMATANSSKLSGQIG